MKLFGLILTRNSQWCIGLTARAALMWCDALVIVEHATVDPELTVGRIATEFPGRVFWHREPDPTFREMAMRQDMLNIARYHGATHIALIDDDELLTGNLLPKIRQFVEHLPAGLILQLPWLSLRADGVMVSGRWGRENVSTAFKDDAKFHWTARGGYDLHHRHPMGIEFVPRVVREDRDGGLLHLQFMSRRRLIAKQFLYQLMERARWPDRESVDVVRERYVSTVNEADGAKVADLPDCWIEPYGALLKYYDYAAEPWQESECRRIVGENPQLAWGLEDFGLMKQWEREGHQ